MRGVLLPQGVDCVQYACSEARSIRRRCAAAAYLGRGVAADQIAAERARDDEEMADAVDDDDDGHDVSAGARRVSEHTLIYLTKPAGL